MVNAISKGIISELTLGDLQEQHRRLAEVIGLEALIKLSDYYGGTQLYIPQIFELVKELLFTKIDLEFTGDNVQQLAIKYKVSESTVRRIVKDRILQKKIGPMDGQIGLEDMGTG